MHAVIRQPIRCYRDVLKANLETCILYHNYTFFLKFYFILLYNTVLVLPYINMNPPRVYTCSQS